MKLSVLFMLVPMIASRFIRTAARPRGGAFVSSFASRALFVRATADTGAPPTGLRPTSRAMPSASPLRTGRAGFASMSIAPPAAVGGTKVLAADMAIADRDAPAYEVTRIEDIDEYTVKCATYRHTKSGAELISAQADDDNKVFGIVFRTPVSDSTGVPHILEHSVLCGSDKYTSKEPFVELLKGSLQTFLNAFTYPDRTCYPVASQNTKDFYNLVNVYLDAVLHPRAKRDPTVLSQEGWHYELETPEEPLTYKGVVFNEMKGVYSSPDSLMYRAAQQLTFPDNTYSVDSGGDPVAIPSLTFDQFKSFHDSYYHPANSRIFFYGDDDLYTRLDLLDSYLKHFDAADTSAPATSEVATQKLIQQPRRKVEKYPVAPDEAEPKHMVMLSWLLHEDALSSDDELALGVLDHLLMGTSDVGALQAADRLGPRRAVIGGGLSDELKQATFSVGSQGRQGGGRDQGRGARGGTLKARARARASRRTRSRRRSTRSSSAARVQHGRLPARPELHARRDAQLALRPRPDRTRCASRRRSPSSRPSWRRASPSSRALSPSCCSTTATA